MEITMPINIGLGAGSCPVLSGTNGATPALMWKSWLVIISAGVKTSKKVKK